MTAAEYLRTALLRRHMRHKDLADKLHVTESTVQKWCVGKNSIPADRIVEIAGILQISPFLLLGIDANDNRPYRSLSTGYMAPDIDLFSHPAAPAASLDVCHAAVSVLAMQFLLDKDETLTESDRLLLTDKISDIVSENMGQLDFDAVLSFLRTYYDADQLFLHFCRNMTMYEYFLSISMAEYSNV